jgi:hypothetical protein
MKSLLQTRKNKSFHIQKEKRFLLAFGNFLRSSLHFKISLVLNNFNR